MACRHYRRRLRRPVMDSLADKNNFEVPIAKASINSRSNIESQKIDDIICGLGLHGEKDAATSCTHEPCRYWRRQNLVL